MVKVLVSLCFFHMTWSFKMNILKWRNNEVTIIWKIVHSLKCFWCLITSSQSVSIWVPSFYEKFYIKIIKQIIWLNYMTYKINIFVSYSYTSKIWMEIIFRVTLFFPRDWRLSYILVPFLVFIWDKVLLSHRVT